MEKHLDKFPGADAASRCRTTALIFPSLLHLFSFNRVKNTFKLKKPKDGKIRVSEE